MLISLAGSAAESSVEGDSDRARASFDTHFRTAWAASAAGGGDAYRDFLAAADRRAAEICGLPFFWAAVHGLAAALLARGWIGEPEVRTLLSTAALEGPSGGVAPPSPLRPADGPPPPDSV